MADFFDKLKKGAKETAEKATILAKIGGLKTQIANINLKKKGVFEDLGRAFFEEVKKGNFQELPENIKAIIDSINALDEEIKKLEGEIEKLNEDLKKVGETPEEVTVEEKPEENKEENK